MLDFLSLRCVDEVQDPTHMLILPHLTREGSNSHLELVHKILNISCTREEEYVQPKF